MSNLSTSYLGLRLKNPLIATGIVATNSLSSLKKIEKAGAGAILLHPLYEEQILSSRAKTDETHKINAVKNYIDLIVSSKKSLKIPIIANIDFINVDNCIPVLKEIEKAGADAIELCVYYFPEDKDFRADDYEKTFFDIATKVSATIKIPLSFKIGYNLTNILNIADNLFYRGISGINLFNRSFETDIDIEKMRFIPPKSHLSSNNIEHSLCWINLLSLQGDKLDIATSGIITDHTSFIKAILAGADVVILDYILEEKGIDYIKIMLTEIEKWIKKHNIDSLFLLKGKIDKSVALNYRNNIVKLLTNC
jgi:dihydroorotate dehydrogenase (fumarate)